MFTGCGAGLRFGPLLTAASTARSKRDHASGSSPTPTGSFLWFPGMSSTPDRFDSAAQHLGVDKDHLTAIGIVSLGWVSAEFDMQYALWTMLGLDQKVGELITNMIANVSRTELLRNAAMVHFQDADFLSEVDDICAFFNAIRVERNNLSHALPPEGDKTATLTKRHVTGKATGAVKSKIIQSDVEHCFEIFADMQTFRKCVAPMALNVKSALSHGNQPKTLMGHAVTSRHIIHMRSRLDFLRKRQSSP
ncbi:hypothetical protein [Methylocystis iwaonis]|nr:hypothetical protein [Methylocystis iwaonis]